jgi:hypothetical protein
MPKKYLINTKKKRFAFEIIILVFTIFSCTSIFLIWNYIESYHYDNYNKKKQVINSKIDSLKDNAFRNRYDNLNKYEKINDYTYESYKKKILNERDSSFRREIYYRLCNLYSAYSNERTLDEFINQFEYNSINKIDEQISSLELQSEELSKELPETNNIHIILIVILLTIIYPLRYIYYLIRWSLNTLKETENEKEIEKENQQSVIQSKKDFNSLNINSNTDFLNDNKNEKSKFTNYFTFNNEYINGLSYLNRTIIGIFTFWIFGLGIYLMLTTIYKRSKSLGLSKKFSIFNCILIPSLFIFSFTLNFIETNELEYSNNNIFTSFLLRVLIGLPHLILVFKNGTRKKIGKFQIRN